MKTLNSFKMMGLIVVVAMLFSPVVWAATEEVKININTASAEELTALKYVGDKSAQKIIEHREANGPFEKVEDLLNVPGIGPKTLEVNREKIVLK